MKSKAPLALIELVIMILIFAVSAALCLKAFMWAQQQAKDIALRDIAILQVQNSAELVKAGRGDLSLVRSEDPAVIISGKLLEPDKEGLEGARITAANEKGEELFSVDIYWQDAPEGGRHE